MAIARGEYTITELYDGDNFYRAWADSDDGSVRFSTTESDRLYMGTYVGLTRPSSPSQYTWSKIVGESAVIGALSNDTHQIGTNQDGEEGNYHGANTTLTIFRGGVEETNDWNIDISISPVNSIEGKLSDYTYTVTKLKTDEATVTFNATHKTRTQDSKITKVFSLSKNKQGIDGKDAKGYFLNFNDTSIRKNRVTNEILPENLVIGGYSITGEAEPVPASGYFKVFTQSEISVDRDEYEQAYINGLLDSEEYYVLSEDNYPLILEYESKEAEDELIYGVTQLIELMSVKVYWYKDSEFKHLLDMQTVHITSDGIDGEQGPRGLQGLQGPDGKQGIQGPAGDDGESTYTHIAYATSKTGADFSHSTFDNATYIGMYVSNESDSSGSPADYEWTLIKGRDGRDGIEGKHGTAGMSSFVHFAYADSADGTVNFSTTDSNREYIGTYTDSTITDYEGGRNLIKRSDFGNIVLSGINGFAVLDEDYQNGLKATGGNNGRNNYIEFPNVLSGNGWYTVSFLARGTQGGTRGLSVIIGDSSAITDGRISNSSNEYTYHTYSYNVENYDKETNNSIKIAELDYAYYRIDNIKLEKGNIATDWSPAPEDIIPDSNNPEDYSWTKIKGDKGDTGPQGDDGKGIKSQVVTYQNHTNGTTAPTGTWTDNPSPVKGRYLWTRTVTQYTEGNPITTYAVAYNAKDGIDGDGIVKVTVRYAVTSTSTQPADSAFTYTSLPTPENGTYIWTKTVTEYKLSPNTITISSSYVGVDGRDGTDGKDGQDGVGIQSEVISYGISTSASVQPTTWYSEANMPVVQNGEYLWTRTITDYTDPNRQDTVRYTYTHQGLDGQRGPVGQAGTSVTVSKIEYKSGSSATTPPTGSWSSNPVSVSKGNYLWTKTTFSDGKTAYTMAYQGTDGAPGAKGDPGAAGKDAVVVSSTAPTDTTRIWRKSLTAKELYIYVSGAWTRVDQEALSAISTKADIDLLEAIRDAMDQLNTDASEDIGKNEETIRAILEELARLKNNEGTGALDRIAQEIQGLIDREVVWDQDKIDEIVASLQNQYPELFRLTQRVSMDDTGTTFYAVDSEGGAMGTATKIKNDGMYIETDGIDVARFTREGTRTRSLQIDGNAYFGNHMVFKSGSDYTIFSHVGDLGEM